jgi:hypothetical protein
MTMNPGIVVAATGALLAHSAAFAGMTFTQVTSIDGSRASLTKTTVDAGSVKLETLESSTPNPFMPVGSYLLMTNGETVLVNPAARTFARFDTALPEGMAGMLGRMDIGDVKFDKVLDEDGGSLEGYPTRHYRFESSWTMGVQGMPMKTEMGFVEDIWATTAIELPAMPENNENEMPEQVRAVADAQGLREIEGMPLKRVTVQSTKVNMGALGGMAGLGARMAGGMLGGGGRGRRGGSGDDAGVGGVGAGGNSETTTTVEVTDIATVDVPASTFEIPEGFSETSLLQTGPALPSLNDVQEAPPAVPKLNDLN